MFLTILLRTVCSTCLASYWPPMACAITEYESITSRLAPNLLIASSMSQVTLPIPCGVVENISRNLEAPVLLDGLEVESDRLHVLEEALPPLANET